MEKEVQASARGRMPNGFSDQEKTGRCIYSNYYGHNDEIVEVLGYQYDIRLGALYNQSLRCLHLLAWEEGITKESLVSREGRVLTTPTVVLLYKGLHE